MAEQSSSKPPESSQELIKMGSSYSGTGHDEIVDSRSNKHGSDACCDVGYEWNELLSKHEAWWMK